MWICLYHIIIKHSSVHTHGTHNTSVHFVTYLCYICVTKNKATININVIKFQVSEQQTWWNVFSGCTCDVYPNIRIDKNKLMHFLYD